MHLVGENPLAPVIERTLIEVSEEVLLEARWDKPEDLRSIVVFCHPHPQHRGTMTAPLMVGVTAELVRVGIGVLRFNFRGVGKSSGVWSSGEGEQDDIGSAIDVAISTHPELAIGIAGWSFGAATSLLWQAREGSSLPWVGIAPPVFSDLTPRLPDPAELPPASRTFIVGDRDQFVTVGDATVYAESIGASIHVLPGSDHFFHFRFDKVAAHVIAALDGTVTSA